MKSQANITERVENAARAILADTGKVTAFDLLVRLNWLHERHVKMWQRRHEYCEFIELSMQSTPERRIRALACFERWGKEQGLETTAVAFFPNAREPRNELQVTPSGHPELERLYRLCFIKPNLSAKKHQAIEEKAKKRPDLCVFVSFREGTCAAAAGWGGVRLVASWTRAQSSLPCALTYVMNTRPTTRCFTPWATANPPAAASPPPWTTLRSSGKPVEGIRGQSYYLHL